MRRFAAVAAFLAAILVGCGGEQKAHLDAIEARIERLESMFPGEVAYSSEAPMEIVTEPPALTEGARPFDFPENLPAEAQEAIEKAMRGEGIPQGGIRVRTLKGGDSQWETAAVKAKGNLVIPRASMPAVLVGDAILVIGGFGPGEMLEKFRNDVEVVAPGGEVERRKTQLLRRRYHFAEAYRGRIYIGGGQTVSVGHGWQNSFPDTFEIFDPATGRVTTAAPLPSRRYLASSAILDGKIYVAGGSVPAMRPQPGGSSSTANSPPDAALLIYDLAAGRWNDGAPMSVARQTDLVVHSGKIYAVAGYDGTKPVRVFEEYDPRTGKWSRLPDLPFAISAHRCESAGDFIFTFGDYSDRSRICAYDFKTRRWKKLSVRMQPARHAAVVRVGDRILVIGGNDGRTTEDYDGGAGGESLGTIQVFDVEALIAAAS